MRIDIVQSAPTPEIPQVSQGGGTSTSYDSDLSSGSKKSSEATETQKSSESTGSALEDKVSRANEKLRQSGTKIQFKIHKNPNRIITQIVDSDTNEVIKEIPPEKMIEIVDSIDKTAGRNIDKKI